MKLILKLVKGFALRFWLAVGCYWRRLKNIGSLNRETRQSRVPLSSPALDIYLYSCLSSWSGCSCRHFQ
jgi:hypothetical protein